MTIHRLPALAALLLCAGAAPAATLAEFTGGSNFVDEFVGQSFMIDTGGAGGSFDHIRFNFFLDAAPMAQGTLYIFDTPYFGTPNDLASASAGLVGSSEVSISGGIYVFATDLVLLGGVTYHAYSDTALTLHAAFFDGYAGGAAYGAPYVQPTLGTLPFVLRADRDLQFRVTGDIVTAVPEPRSWALMIGGLGLAGGAMRKRRRVGTGAASLAGSAGQE